MNCPSGLRFDLSAPFAPVSLPQRLRRLADIAEADALDVDAWLGVAKGALQSKRAQLEIDRLPAFNVLVVGQFERPFRSEDFQPGCPRAGDVVVIEIPHRMNGGRCISWAELSKIAHLVKAAGARLHMDGARLSEALPFYSALQVQREELCGLFDSIYLSWRLSIGSE
eukprot:Skav208225  [mRNA]  locus=scaffold3686:130482:134675:- [translate_table: standard]